MSAPLCVIAAGGTGGHMFPAQALSEQLLDRGWRVMLSTDPRGARYTSGFPEAVEIEEIASATFARGGLAAKAAAPFRIGGGVARTIWRFRRLRPALVAGFGGYPTIPALSAATALRLPRMIHEQNGVLGRVNRAFAPRVPLVACGTWPTDLPDGVQSVHVGNPVRASIHDRAGAPYIPPGEQAISLLVIGGSQGARVLSRIVPEAVSRLAGPLRAALRISHQARQEDAAWVSQIYAEAGIAAEVRPFFHDIPARMSEAQLVISRAGASSLADLTVIGRPAILVPYAAAAADHQSANARALAEAEAAAVIPEAGFTAEAVAETIETILSRPQAATRMAAQALSLGRPNAARDLADLAEAVAGMDSTTRTRAGQP